MALTFDTHVGSIDQFTSMHVPTLRSKAAIVFKKLNYFHFLFHMKA